MKTHLAQVKIWNKIVFGLFGIFILTMSLGACTNKTGDNHVFYNKDDYSGYSKVLEKVMPSFIIEEAENKAYYILDKDGVAEAFDVQASGAIETGIANYWYPHYLATVIIAVDRDQTDASIFGWTDLVSTRQEVSFFDTPGNVQMFTAAMSYGLEGEHFTMTKTTKLLASLHKNNCLKLNSFDSPILICFDYQAVALKENGRNIEIIVPKEGTYTYAKGLLSKEKLSFRDDIEELLIEANFTILNDESIHTPAIRVQDHKHFVKAVENVNSIISRKVYNAKKYMSIDNREHLHFALIYIIFVTLWVASFMRKSTQKGISYAALCTGVILNSWTLVRLIKYQIDVNPILTRYLWYSYYIFELTLPLVLLWMAWAIDKPVNKIFPPKWWCSLAVVVNLLILFVFTNDLHGFVLKLDLNKSDWGINYSYGFGYYIILIVCMANILGMFAILVYKSLKNPRKNRFVFPFSLLVIFIIYNYGYITRIPIIYETDITIVTGLFTILLFESCIRSGLIPVNTKYIKLFASSPLKMQILNKKGELIIASAASTLVPKENLFKAIALSPEPFFQEDATLLFANSILGGYVICQEDVSKLNQLVNDMQKSTLLLKEANTMLAKEEKIKRLINEKNAKKQLTEQLEDEIAEKIELLSLMIEKLPYVENYSTETARIAILLCYIKGRCNLFFKEKEINFMQSEELVIFLDEIAEIGKYGKVKIATINEIRESISIRHATLFYDIFYRIIDLVISLGYDYIIIYLETGENSVVMRLLPSKDIGVFEMEKRLRAAVISVNGEFSIKTLDETVGISISFPKGGD